MIAKLTANMPAPSTHAKKNLRGRWQTNGSATPQPRATKGVPRNKATRSELKSESGSSGSRIKLRHPASITARVANDGKSPSPQTIAARMESSQRHDWSLVTRAGRYATVTSSPSAAQSSFPPSPAPRDPHSFPACGLPRGQDRQGRPVDRLPRSQTPRRSPSSG